LKQGFKGIAERRALVVLGDTLDEPLLFHEATEQSRVRCNPGSAEDYRSIWLSLSLLVQNGASNLCSI
jgi:hypothetical protein